MAYLLFNAVDGKLIRNQVKRKEDADLVYREAAKLAHSVIRKLEKFIADNISRLEKPASIKTFVLLLKPLDDAIKICNSDDSVLFENWFLRVKDILENIGNIFPK